MKLTNKQKRIIDTILWFAPQNCDWEDKTVLSTLLRNTPECNQMIDIETGVPPEDAYFAKTDRGIRIMKVNGLGRFLKLYWGHKRMALQITMWKEGFAEGTCLPQDFILEKGFVREIVLRDVFGLEPDWYLKYVIKKLEDYNPL